MNYINKNTGAVAATLEYMSHGSWDVYPSEDNRYRVLKNGETITAIDLNVNGGLIEVGSKMPGYNRYVNEIVQVHNPDDEYKAYFEVYCDDEYTID
jgi:hypothetical protein